MMFKETPEQEEIKLRKAERRLGSVNELDTLIVKGYASKVDVLWEALNTKIKHMETK